MDCFFLFFHNMKLQVLEPRILNCEISDDWLWFAVFFLLLLLLLFFFIACLCIFCTLMRFKIYTYIIFIWFLILARKTLFLNRFKLLLLNLQQTTIQYNVTLCHVSYIYFCFLNGFFFFHFIIMIKATPHPNKLRFFQCGRRDM